MDLVIAMVATAWVLLVVVFSRWLIGPPEVSVESAADSVETAGFSVKFYQDTLVSALREPLENLRYLVFGIIMGLSTLLPTSFHLIMALRALVAGKRQA